MSRSGDIAITESNGLANKGEDMNINRSKLEKLARDLRKEEPRPAHLKLGNFEMAARTLDKCRATLLGIEGEYRFGCPMDQQFFAEAGISGDEFQSIVATGASDDEVARWVEQHADSESVR
jgi:hypothetical protein